MAPRTRVLAFGSAAVLVVAGALCAVFLGGFTGELLTLVLVSIGGVGAVLLVFLEVGLSEDRERARDEEHRRRRAERRVESQRPRRLRRRPRRPG